MKDMIIQQLKERVGLSEEQAKNAMEVVAEILEGNGVTLVEGIKDKLGGAGEALGGLIGKK
ncbi:MAG: hypothetical protein AAGE52_31725 [Myxococcota bacterium]